MRDIIEACLILVACLGLMVLSVVGTAYVMDLPSHYVWLKVCGLLGVVATVIMSLAAAAHAYHVWTLPPQLRR